MFKKIKNLWQKKLFKKGDRVRCPCCGTIFTLVKFEGKKLPKGYCATVEIGERK